MRKCDARQYSDEMICGHCKMTWAVNDSDAPVCGKALAAATAADLTKMGLGFVAVERRRGPYAKSVEQISRREQIDANGWILVSDLRPPLHEEVFVWPEPNEWCLTAELRRDGWGWAEYEPGHGVVWNALYIAPTHWRPMFKPPVTP